MVDVTVEHLRQIMPECRTPEEWVSPLAQAMARFAIDRECRIAAFLAQIAAESGELRQLEENLDYRADRLRALWPHRFPTVAAARPYAHAPVKLADFIYANRLGNGNEASGDGWRFRGRGLIQITGRDNYREAATALGRPYEDEPQLLARPADAALSAAHFWRSKGLNELADDDANFAAITEIVTGGRTGAARREQYWAQAKGALAVA